MAEKLNLAYDKRADVLYVSVGRPRRAVSNELGDDVLVRVDPRTKRVVGFTILNFERWFVHHRGGRMVPVLGDLKVARA